MLHNGILGLWLAMIGSLGAQTTGELTSKYGHPQMEEYALTPEVSLTVSYGEDRVACRLLVKGRQASFFSDDKVKETVYIATSLADRLSQELAPISIRKGKVASSLFQSGCTAFRNDDYQNVRINRVTNECHSAQADGTLSLLVEWKRPACKNLKDRSTDKDTPKF